MDTQSAAIRAPPAAEKRRAAVRSGSGPGALAAPVPLPNAERPAELSPLSAPPGLARPLGAAGGGAGRRGHVDVTAALCPAGSSRGSGTAAPGAAASPRRAGSSGPGRGAASRRAEPRGRGGGGGGPGAAGVDAERSRAGGGGGGSGHGGAPLKEAAREEEEERGGEEKSPHSLPPRPVPSADRLPRACPAEAAAEDFGIRRGPAVLPRPFSAANKGGEREEGRAHLRGASMADRSLESVSLPLEVRARLAELELELSEGKGAAPRVRPVPARRPAAGGSGGFVPPGSPAAEVGAGPAGSARRCAAGYGRWKNPRGGARPAEKGRLHRDAP